MKNDVRQAYWEGYEAGKSSNIETIRAAINRIQSYCGDIDCQRGMRNILNELRKINGTLL